MHEQLETNQVSAKNRHHSTSLMMHGGMASIFSHACDISYKITIKFIFRWFLTVLADIFAVLVVLVDFFKAHLFHVPQETFGTIVR